MFVIEINTNTPLPPQKKINKKNKTNTIYQKKQNKQHMNNRNLSKVKG